MHSLELTSTRCFNKEATFIHTQMDVDHSNIPVDHIGSSEIATEIQQQTKSEFATTPVKKEKHLRLLRVLNGSVKLRKP
jgi:hypothetical protein